MGGILGSSGGHQAMTWGHHGGSVDNLGQQGASRGSLGYRGQHGDSGGITWGIWGMKRDIFDKCTWGSKGHVGVP